MSVATLSLTLPELQQKLHIKLASTSEFSDYPPGHEAVICLVDARSFRCVGCPPPLNGRRARVAPPSATKACRLTAAFGGGAFGCRQGQAQAKRPKEHSLQRLRRFALLVGHVLLWYRRAVEQANAPGRRGYEEARAEYEARLSL